MDKVDVGGLQFSYQIAGARDAPPLVLIMGLGSQLTHWPDDFVAAIAGRGFRVVRFDNRDAGLSSRVPRGVVPDIEALVHGAVPNPTPPGAYTLIDMAADTAGLIRELGLGPAHLVGVSMGGRIAQLTAALYPKRVRALIPIMSFSGAPVFDPGSAPARRVLYEKPRDEGDPEAILDHLVRVYQTINGSGFPWPEADLRAHLSRSYHRAYDPDGVARQMAAVAGTPFDPELHGRIKAPTLVIHGSEDALVPLDRGADLARRIPGAHLQIVDGMGHTLAPGLRALLVDLIADHCRAADHRS